MITRLNHYLNSVKDNLRLDPSSEKEIIDELKTHVEDRFQEMKDAGLSDDEAAEECIGLLGSARLVARQVYEAHSQGTWRQALLASMPHLFFASLFALKWYSIGWLPALLGAIFVIAIYGWCHGKPAWLFPWLGYSLLPVVAAGLFLLYLPKGWAWVTILLYVPLVLWLLCYITIKSIKRDWLYSALTLLPVPNIIGWFLAVEQGGFSGFSFERLHNFAPWMGLSFLVLAVAVATFIRLRKRWLKVAVLFISGLLSLIMVACYAEGRLGLPTFLVLILVLSALFLTPALLERKIRYSGQRPTA